MFSFFKKKKSDAPVKKAKSKNEPAKKPVKAETQQAEAAPASKPVASPPTSLKAALAAMDEAIPGAVEEKPAPKISAGANLDKAKEALAKKVSQPLDREALIKQALAIQQTQAKMLEKLPEATRNKLRDMAMKAFVVDEPKTKDQKKKKN